MNKLLKNSSYFDNVDRPDMDIINDCVHCGFCLSTCPTYLETGNELDSPRGRIYLMKSVLEQNIPLGSSVVDHLDKCLGCLACETSCPSGVKYRFLIENSRSQIEKHYKRGLKDRLTRDFIFKLFPYPDRLKPLLPLLYLYDRSGLRRLFQSRRTRRVIPAAIQNMIDMIPSVKNFLHKEMPEIMRAEGNRRYRVGILKGCVQDAWFSNVNRSTVNVLVKNGCDVLIPPDQGCCGALSIHSGRLDEGRKFARKLIDSFLSLNLDAIIVNSAGCGSSVKDYIKLLKHDSSYSEKAKKISSITKDIMEFLDEAGLNTGLKKMEMSVTYQDACHIVHGQKISDSPRKLLKMIPGIDFIELPESDHCCGSAGIYNLIQPDMSADILERKMKNVISTGADYLAVSNPGCLMQLQKGARLSDANIRIVHPVEILDKAISS